MSAGDNLRMVSEAIVNFLRSFYKTRIPDLGKIIKKRIFSNVFRDYFGVLIFIYILSKVIGKSVHINALKIRLLYLFQIFIFKQAHEHITYIQYTYKQNFTLCSMSYFSLILKTDLF